MKNKKIIMILVGIAILLAIICLLTYFIMIKIDNNKESQVQNLVKVEEDGTKVNVSPKISQTKAVDGLEITGLTIEENENITKVSGTITNKSQEEKGDYIITITFLDKEGKVMTTIEPWIKKLQPGESTNLNASTTFDYTNVYDIQISK